MCLVLLSFQTHPRVPLLVAANRDEFLRRPSAPPTWWPASTSAAGQPSLPRIFAGQDLEAGGTWMGLNSQGLMAALTNHYRPDYVPPPEVKSRGKIVEGVLGCTSAEEAAEWVGSLPTSAYRPFNLLFGTAKVMYSLAAPGTAPATLHQLEPGHYALSNSALNDATWPKVARSLAFLHANAQQKEDDWIHQAQAFLCEREAAPLAGKGQLPTTQEQHEALEREDRGPQSAVCIRLADYGTVSSSLLSMGGPQGQRYFFADGEPMRQGRPPEQCFAELTTGI